MTDQPIDRNLKKRALIRRLGFVVLGLVLVMTFAYVVFRSGPLAPIRITLTQVEEGTISPSLFGVGIVEARRTFLLGPTSPGRVRKVLVDVGESVNAGQLLAEMESVDLEARGVALDASVARSRSALAAAEAQRQDAQARYQLAGINARRYVDLGEKKFVSVGVVDAKQQEQISARATMDAAEANLAGSRQDVARLQAEREGLKQQHNNLRMLAPIDGVIVSRDAEPGSTVVAGQTLLKLIDQSNRWIKVRIDQGRSAGLAVGLPAQITMRSSPENIRHGKVVRLELLSDSVTEERVAQVEFNGPTGEISLGELAEVSLALPKIEKGLLLPNASIKRHGKVVGVWIFEEGKLRFAEVELGSVGLEGKVQVRAGVKAGDQVVVYNEKELTTNSSVKIVEALADPAP